MRVNYECDVRPYLDAIAGWARNNVTTKDIARNLGIGYSTFRRYIRDHKDLEACLRINREEADRLVEAALYRRAVGYEYTEETVELVDDTFKVTKIVTKVIPPNTHASKQWLALRRPDKWSLKSPQDGSSTQDLGKILEESGERAKKRREEAEAEAEAAAAEADTGKDEAADADTGEDEPTELQ
jgi:hypothetical protein